MKSWMRTVFLLVALCGYAFVSTTLAAPLPFGQKVLIVDGQGDGNTGVTPTVIAPLSPANGFEFGQVLGGSFSPIVSEVTELAGGSLVDFAIHETGKPLTAFASLTNPGLIGLTATFATPLPATSAQVPNALGGNYYNTLTLSWTFMGNLFEFEFLNAGGVNDGFQPVPVPTAALLFGTGLIGLIGIARRSWFVQ